MRAAGNSLRGAPSFSCCTPPRRSAIAAHARVATDSARALVIVGFVMEAGAALFSAELAMRAFTGERIFPFAAPIGGSTMMISWLALAIVFAAAVRRQK